MNTQDLKALDRQHIVYSWKAQGQVDPVIIDRAKGIYMWDTDGNRITDFCSGLLNVNIGHSNEHVLDAMRKQMDKLCYVGTMFGTEPKAQLGKMISEVTPGDLNHVFFTNGGAEAVENAIKAARWYTGRHKIYARWRSYHGATSGAITLTGDPRRWPAEPGIPGVVHYFGPYPYRCPFGSTSDEECGERTLEVLKTQIMLDGPETIAAIFLEPIVGTNGIIVPPKNYVQGLRKLCDEHGILMVSDETMAGWGRSGKWFGIDNYDVVPDIITTAKGLTSGYVQLGAMIWSKKIWDHYQTNPFVGGLTYAGHALACATGIANIEVYKNENLIDKSRDNGKYLAGKLKELENKHACVGDTRAQGLWAVIELTSDKKTKAPLGGFNNSEKNIAGQIMKRLIADGLYIFAKWDFMFIAPPLIITKEEIDESVVKLDKVLDWVDTQI
ncbi:MAG: aminotransferase class III-fold pyridoxal phosphate-dependent enzyme [Spirochaetales bacterium]|nr:aminotransferase class III-fold pyridoxal phosphate-dependent enzyme [Spirochaetales bacterium]MCF7938716.1 aminotransferase class III-fold pyridoxal phosphate-dependent enzyme [Spirochaetales bacterium]